MIPMKFEIYITTTLRKYIYQQFWYKSKIYISRYVIEDEDEIQIFCYFVYVNITFKKFYFIFIYKD